MDLNLLLFHKKPLLLTNTENNHINYYGTLSILLLDMLIIVNSLKWIIMNSVLEFLIVISVLLTSIVVGVKLPEDVCPEIKNIPFVPLLVSTDGSMMLNHVPVKFMLVCSLMLPLKLPVSLPLKKLNLNNTLDLYYITKLLFLLLLFWEPKELNMKLLELIHSLESKFLMILMKLKPPFSDKSIKL